jgi:hypothetical protein
VTSGLPRVAARQFLSSGSCCTRDLNGRMHRLRIEQPKNRFRCYAE